MRRLRSHTRYHWSRFGWSSRRLWQCIGTLQGSGRALYSWSTASTCHNNLPQQARKKNTCWLQLELGLYDTCRLWCRSHACLFEAHGSRHSKAICCERDAGQSSSPCSGRASRGPVARMGQGSATAGREKILGCNLKAKAHKRTWSWCITIDMWMLAFTLYIIHAAGSAIRKMWHCHVLFLLCVPQWGRMEVSDCMFDVICLTCDSCGCCEVVGSD